ncbi:MAG: serine hydrolase [Candidatus Bruticola sp.]
MNKCTFYALIASLALIMLFGSIQALAEQPAAPDGDTTIAQSELASPYSEQKLQPVTSERVKKVQELLQSQVKAYPELDIGYSVIHIPTSAKLSHQGNKQFPLASVFKIPVLIETCRQLQNDTLPFNIDKQLTIKKEDYCIGSGELINAPVNSKITLDKVLTLMIYISDNTATDMLIHLIGVDSLDRLMSDLRLYDNSIFMSNRQAWLICLGEGSILPDDNPERIAHIWQGLTIQQRRNLAKEVEEANKDLSRSQFQAMEDQSGSKYSFSQQRVVAETVDNQSSPDDFSQLLTKLWRQEILSPDWTDYALSILAKQKYNSRIPRYLPKGSKTYHKTGTISGVVNDSGLIISKRGNPVAITVFIKNVGSGRNDEAAQAIGHISKIVWDNL